MEKYGTIPPKFTKDWWGHYWHYYKFHITLGLILLAGVVYLVLALVNKIDYDLSVEIVTTNYYLTPDETEQLHTRIDSVAQDVTGNNKIDVEYQNDVFSASETNMNDIQQNNAVITRIMAEVETGAKQLYIVDKEIADYLIDFECLLPVSEWAGEIPEERIYKEHLVLVSGNPVFLEMGINTSDLYIGVLELRDDIKDDEALKVKQDNAKYVALELIKE